MFFPVDSSSVDWLGGGVRSLLQNVRAPEHRDHSDRSIVITWIGLVITSSCPETRSGET